MLNKCKAIKDWVKEWNVFVELKGHSEWWNNYESIIFDIGEFVFNDVWSAVLRYHNKPNII